MSNMSTSKKQTIQIRLKSFDHKAIDTSAERIVETAKRTGAQVRGPVPLPTRIEKLNVKNSPHIDSHSQSAFETRTHKRLIIIAETDSRTVEALMGLDVPAGVDVQIALI